MQEKEVNELCVKCNHPVYLHKENGCTAQIQGTPGKSEIEHVMVGKEAVELYHDKKPDMVFLDVSMSEHDMDSMR